MPDERTPFGGSNHVIPRREMSANEVILPQLIEGDALELLRTINAGIAQLNLNIALLAQTIVGEAVFDTVSPN